MLRRRPPQPKLRSHPPCPEIAFRERGAPVHRHGRRTTSRGRLTPYRCGHSASTFTLHTGTADHRLRLSPNRFDEVERMAVEGMSVAGIARSLGISESTVRRWQRKAAERATLFNDAVIQNVPGNEVQADEIKTLVERKERAAWV